MSTRVSHDRLVWTPPAGGFWEGAWPDGERRMPVHDPESGAIVGTVMDATDADVRRAVAYVAAGRHRHAWPLWERREAIERTAAALADAAERFASINTGWHDAHPAQPVP